jgi:hypothetical protein
MNKIGIATYSLAAALCLAVGAPATRAQINLSALTSDQASGGIKEALSRGVSTAVASTGHPGGYFDNPAIKIEMPPRLNRAEQAMRAIGMGPRIDAFVKSMNAAAEQAAPAAKPILLDALKSMTLADAKGIVTGGKTSGTEYFQRTSTPAIQAAFRPLVEQAMAKGGVTAEFEALMSKAPAIPFVKTPQIDINQYVLDKATEGLFVVMGQEEVKIRTDPASQVTPLLKAVFGHK